MNALWWLALPVLLLPIWWHRKKRVQNQAAPMATARFLPRTEPRQTRVWRWSDPLLLLLRCLLLAVLIAWLADPVYPWRGDTVVVTQGADPAWVEREATQAGLANAERVTLPAAQALGWVHTHEREWRSDACLLVLGDVPMPAAKPAFGRAVEVRTQAAAPAKAERHIYIASERAAEWRRMFAAQGGLDTVIVDDAPGAATSLIVWDRAEAPPAALRAPLWWVTQPSAFPELAKARVVDGLRYADSARGRLWHHADWPPHDADAARALLDDWQQLHVGPRHITLAPQTFAAVDGANAPEPSGALRSVLLAVLAALFVLERSLTHARRR
ncbi:BatA domain-containing protein [Massilia sp. CFBP9026]|uniref:BatA domain-containing protein n=1 Tax=Massilia sp. CFBP9026 TaxID=3096536 RepID=UPI002A6A2FE9|nr:BatA domain-containing protein [Massilia sp. CFBP9026]MDY0965345.1 BatA domain-containing protein [Massilia sp. CFBP9026]